jgi:hypothetical protein
MILPSKPPRIPFLPAAILVLAILFSAGLDGCSLLLPAYISTPSPLPATETATIAWFPATNTPTLYIPPTQQPTLEPLSGVGSLLFRDDFSDATLWNTSTSGSASAQVENDRLTLALTSGRLTVLSLRSEPSLGDFYAVATATTSLCRGNDAYGILFRAAPGGYYYRFSLSCSGNIRFERVRGGAADLLQKWVPSGDAPTGAPTEVKISVWASGAELRFFLNDHFQFSLRDPVLHSGTLGFFATASGTTPVLVSFSDLEVYSVFYISPTPTHLPSATPTP